MTNGSTPKPPEPEGVTIDPAVLAKLPPDLLPLVQGVKKAVSEFMVVVRAVRTAQELELKAIEHVYNAQGQILERLTRIEGHIGIPRLVK